MVAQKVIRKIKIEKGIIFHHYKLNKKLIILIKVPTILQHKIESSLTVNYFNKFKLNLFQKI